MWDFFIKINKQLVIAIPIMMAAGFLFGLVNDPALIKQLKQLIMPLTFLMVYPMMVTLNVKHLHEGMKNVCLQLLTQFINFAIIPFLAYGLGLYFFKDQPYMALGLLLASLLPTSGMTISWTGFARGNMGAAINMTVIGLTLGSLATPFYVQALMGAKVDVNIILVIKQILYIVFVPMLLGYITRTALLRKYSMVVFKKEIAPRFPAMSTLGVLGIVFVALALKARAIAADPGLLAAIFVPLFIIYIFNFSLGTVLARMFFQRGDGISLVYGTVMRNLSIALAISINAFGAEGANAALVIAISYIIQVQSAAWYVKLTDLLFGPLPEKYGEEAIA
ncbi:MAG: bile acid:sodium symporter [Thermodesulfobacteriota bacterium]